MILDNDTLWMDDSSQGEVAIKVHSSVVMSYVSGEGEVAVRGNGRRDCLQEVSLYHIDQMSHHILVALLPAYDTL